MAATQNSVARSIRLHLASMNKSQRWLADRMGMTPHRLSRRMGGKVPFSTDDIDRAAEALGVDAVGLMLGLNPSAEASAVS